MSAGYSALYACMRRERIGNAPTCPSFTCGYLFAVEPSLNRTTRKRRTNLIHLKIENFRPEDRYDLGLRSCLGRLTACRPSGPANSPEGRASPSRTGRCRRAEGQALLNPTWARARAAGPALPRSPPREPGQHQQAARLRRDRRPRLHFL